MAFYLLTINKPNNSLISAKKKIRKISLFRFLIKQWRQHPGKGRYLPELPHRQHPQGMLFNMRVCFNKKYCSVPVRAKASHPSLTAFPPVPFRLRTLKNRLPALCFTQNPDTRFAPKILAMICKQVGIKKGDNLQESFWGKSIRKSSYRLSRANKLTLRQL